MWWVATITKMSEESVTRPLLKDIDRLLDVIGDVRGSLLRLRRTLNNPGDPHYHERDLDQLLDLGCMVEHDVYGFAKRLRREEEVKVVRKIPKRRR